MPSVTRTFIYIRQMTHVLWHKLSDKRSLTYVMWHVYWHIRQDRDTCPLKYVKFHTFLTYAKWYTFIGIRQVTHIQWHTSWDTRPLTYIKWHTFNGMLDKLDISCRLFASLEDKYRTDIDTIDSISGIDNHKMRKITDSAHHERDNGTIHKCVYIQNRCIISSPAESSC